MSTDNELPAEKHDDMLLDHAYDGIQEFDNPMPRWWVWLFWGSFWFSAAYIFHYWAGNGQSVASAYDDDVKVAAAVAAKQAMGQEVTEESLSSLMADPTTTESGKGVFVARCSPCHLEGQGAIGPNLTDAFWIHGKGKLLDIYGVVSEGVADKGMPAWNRQLTPAELRQVVAYVGILRGKELTGKAAEGEKVE